MRTKGRLFAFRVGTIDVEVRSSTLILILTAFYGAYWLDRVPAAFAAAVLLTWISTDNY